MCPGTIALVATGITAASQVGQGIANSNAANYQAAVANNNMITAQRNANYTASATSAQVTAEGLKARSTDAQVKAAAAANNVNVNTGSAANVETSQRELGALDTATVANRGALATYGYETQASGFGAQSKLDKAEGQMDLLAGFTQAAGTLLGSPQVGQAASGAFGGNVGASEGNAISPSLISGSPDVPSPYLWMGGDGNNPTDPSELGLG